MVEITLQNIENLSGPQRCGVAFDLWLAGQDAPGLARELPLPSEGYRDPVHAYRRLGRIARSAAEHKLSAFAIHDGRQFIGMGSRQVSRPSPITLSMFQPIAEISYWHRAARTEEVAAKLGIRIAEKLLEVNKLSTVTDPDAVPWMVTLPDDTVKATVCEAVGLNPVGSPQRYDIDDGVTEPRQLWAAS